MWCFVIKYEKKLLSNKISDVKVIKISGVKKTIDEQKNIIKWYGVKEQNMT